MHMHTSCSMVAGITYLGLHGLILSLNCQLFLGVCEVVRLSVSTCM